MENIIDLSQMPNEPFVDILNPDGSVLLHTNNATHFDWVRSKIKEGSLTGYKIKFDDGSTLDINNHGKYNSINHEGKIPGDVWIYVISDLL